MATPTTGTGVRTMLCVMAKMRRRLDQLITLGRADVSTSDDGNTVDDDGSRCSKHLRFPALWIWHYVEHAHRRRITGFGLLSETAANDVRPPMLGSRDMG